VQVFGKIADHRMRVFWHLPLGWNSEPWHESDFLEFATGSRNGQWGRPLFVWFEAELTGGAIYDQPLQLRGNRRRPARCCRYGRVFFCISARDN
jgi:hypothetical protein